MFSLCLAYCLLHPSAQKGAAPKTANPKPSAPAKAPAAFAEQSLGSGVFVTPPITLKKSPEQVKDPGMLKIDTWVGVKGQVSYVAMVGTLKDPEKVTTAGLFTQGALGLLSEDSKVVGGKDLLVQGYPGIAVTVRSADGLTMVSRTYRTEKLIIQTNCVLVTEEGRPAMVDKYLDSVRLPGVGTQTQPGALFTRYPLGDSGLTALFPREPMRNESEVGRGAAKGTLYMFRTDYALRNFTIAYRDLPAAPVPTDDQLDELRVAVTDDILAAFKAKKTAQRDEMIGENQALATNFAVSNMAKGHLLVYRAGNRMICVMEYGVNGYDAPETVRTFLHSVEAKP